MKKLIESIIFTGVLSVSFTAFAEESSHKSNAADSGGKQSSANVAATCNCSSGGHATCSAHPGHAGHEGHYSIAPAGIMSDHIHPAGDVMLSYRYMYMSMADNYIGSDKVSDASVISPTGEGYMVTPTSMEMNMHMLGGMWAPHDKVTLMLMAPYIFKSMDHLRRDGARFTSKSDGWSDLKLSSLINVMNINDNLVNLNIGISMPTGSVTERGFVPGPGNTQLPYPMQLGSGSWDLLPGLTYVGEAGKWSWGVQFLANIRLETNKQGYRLGDEYSATGWGAYRWSDWVSTSLRVAATTWDDISGKDSSLAIPAGAVPTADPSLRGGDRVDVFGGINFYLPGVFEGNRLALEVGGPVYQDLNGPQLGNEWMMMVGWQRYW